MYESDILCGISKGTLRVPLKLQTKYLTLTLNDVILYSIEILRVFLI